MPAARKPLILLGLIVLISTAVLFAGDKKSKAKHPDSTSSAAPCRWKTISGSSTR